MPAALAFFLSPVGRWLLGAAAILAVAGGIWLHGDSHGADRKQRQWDAAVKAQSRKVDNATGRARNDVNSGRVRDPWDRDEF